MGKKVPHGGLVQKEDPKKGNRSNRKGKKWGEKGPREGN